jgi:hypothetical protein
MPDFKAMTDYDSSSDRDVFDSNWAKSFISNPLGESNKKSHKTPVGIDVLSALRRMSSSKKFQTTTSAVNGDRRLISEGTEEDLDSVESKKDEE